MKKYKKIILWVLGIALVIFLFTAYRVYIIVAGNEELTGTQGAVPAPVSSLPELTTDFDDWPQWRGARGDGSSRTTGISTNWDKPLKLFWKVDYLCQDEATASWSSLVVKGNRLVVPGRDLNNDLLFCLESGSGKLLWMGSYPAPSATNHGPGARATPLIDGDRVYSLGRNGDLVCWNLIDGQMIWKKALNEEGAEEPPYGFSGSPLSFRDLILVQGGGNALVMAYRKKDGGLAWKAMSGQGGYAAPVLCSIGVDSLLLVFHATGLSGLQPATGKEAWSVPWETQHGVNATTPIVDGNRVFITSGYGQGCALFEFSATAVKELWRNKRMVAQHTDPLLIGGFLYGYSGESRGRGGEFICLELATGREMWSTKEIGWGTCLLVDGHILCLDTRGKLYLLKPDPSSFKLVTKMESALAGVTHPAWTAPVAANGKLYLRYLQQLACYDLIP